MSRFMESMFKLIFTQSSKRQPQNKEVPSQHREQRARRGRKYHSTRRGRSTERSVQYADSFIFVPNESTVPNRQRANTFGDVLSTQSPQSSRSGRLLTRRSLRSRIAQEVEDGSAIQTSNDQSFIESPNCHIEVTENELDITHQLTAGSYEIFCPPGEKYFELVQRPRSCHSFGREYATPCDCIEPSPHWRYSDNDLASLSEFSEDGDYAEVRDPDKLMRTLGRPLSPQDIRLTERIGEGQFGDVHKGVLYPDTTEEALVAVKTCKPDAAPEEKVKFLQEAAIMKQFNHPNIIKLFGVVTHGMTTYIVMELAPLGQLRQHLLLHGDNISRDILLNYIKQLCSAMVHLESKNYVHRDIAARNILLLSPDKIKLSDFGLSRWLEEADFYVASRGKLPIKWMAPESINFRRFTGASDVWMFGVCCWEILMRGVKPFMGIRNDAVISKLEQGERLPLPADCPPSLFNLMSRCWQYHPEDRPSFSDIEMQLSVILKQEKHFMNITGRTRGYEKPERPPQLVQVPSDGQLRRSANFDDTLPDPSPPLLPRSIAINNRPLPPEPAPSPPHVPVGPKRRQNGSDSSNVDPYLVTTLPGAGPVSRTLSNVSPVTSPSHDDLARKKSFSPVPPPAIVKQQQLERQQLNSRPISEGVYYSTVSSDIDNIISSHSTDHLPREPSPYEESYNDRSSSNENIEQVEDDEEDPLTEDILSSTTAVVKSVMELSNKLQSAKPNDYVELVKGVGLTLRELLAKVDRGLDSLPDHTHQKVKMAHRVLSSDMQQLVKSMKELQENYHSFLLDHYQKQMLQSATIIAVNSKHLLEAFTSARRATKRTR